MIRIIVGDKTATGLFPYKIDGHWGPQGAPLVGICENPILEASRVLAALGVSIYSSVELLGAIGKFRTTIEDGLRLGLPSPLKALPKPRRGRRGVLQVKGSGVPGDG